jgi:hypothetical protein
MNEIEDLDNHIRSYADDLSFPDDDDSTILEFANVMHPCQKIEKKISRELEEQEIEETLLLSQKRPRLSNTESTSEGDLILSFKEYYDFIQRDNLYPIQELGRIPDGEFLPLQKEGRNNSRKKSSQMWAYQDIFLRFSFLIQNIILKKGFYVTGNIFDPSKGSTELVFVPSPYTVIPTAWLVFNIRINKGQKRWINRLLKEGKIDSSFIYIVK